MYKSPISIYETAMETIIEQRENAIFAKVQDAFGVEVDKDELIRALQYDRNQYEAGYKDGKADAAPKWIPVSERLPKPFVFVLVQMPWKEPFPTVREGFISKDGIWHSALYIREPGEVTHWMPLPEPPKEEA